MKPNKDIPKMGPFLDTRERMRLIISTIDMFYRFTPNVNINLESFINMSNLELISMNDILKEYTIYNHPISDAEYDYCDPMPF